MRRQPSKPAIEVEWNKVSAKHPCVVCSSHAGCLRGVDDEFACCAHVRSEWPLSAGGWVHRVSRGDAFGAEAPCERRCEDHGIAMRARPPMTALNVAS